MGNVQQALSHDPIIVALISLCAALISAAISAIVAIYISRSSTRREIKKSQIGSLMDKITSQRMALYPDLYHLISNMIKVIKQEPLVTPPVAFTRGYLLAALKSINDWDNRNAIFLGSGAISSIIWFKFTAYQILGQYQADDAPIADVDHCNQIIAAIEKLELALKNEIGIFPLEYGLEKTRAPDYGVIDGRRNPGS